MPTSLRWYCWLQTHRYYIYSFTCICSFLTIVLGWLTFSQYHSYISQEEQLTQMQYSEYTKSINKNVKLLQARESYGLHEKTERNTPYILLTVLDQAMQYNIIFNSMEFTDDGFSMEGLVRNEQSYQSFLQGIQSNLKGFSCNGKYETSHDKKVYTFHVDGHTRQHVQTNSNELSHHNL